MEDIYLKEKRDKKKKKQAWSSFFFNLFYKTLVVFCLLAIDFILFADAGSYQIFIEDNIIAPEFYNILIILFIISFAVIYISSFSNFFQNIVLILVFIGISTAFLNRFAMFNKGAMLYGIISSYLGDNVGEIFIYNSHVILIALFSILLFIFFTISQRSTLVYFTGTLIIILLGVMTNTYFTSHKGKSDYIVSLDNSHPLIENFQAKRFIHISLPDIGSVANMNYGEKSIINNRTQKYTQKTKNNILGFYEQNNFMLYQNAYVFEPNLFMNLVQNMNPSVSSDNLDNIILDRVSIDSLWNFSNINNNYLYLRNTQLFSSFRKAKYNISVYQSRGVELCNQQENVSRCIRKQNFPVNLNILNIPTWKKGVILFAQWIESSGIFKDFSSLYAITKPFFNIKDIPLLSYSTNSFYVINSINVFDILAKDIAEDKTNYAYFVFVDLPSDMYIYDEFCKIKPIKDWEFEKGQPWVSAVNENKKIYAYNEQINCLYGKLEEFMQRLEKSGVLEKSVVVIQGLSGFDNFNKTSYNMYINDFKGNNLSAIAIRDPLKKESEIHNDVCLSSNILKSYLFKSPQCEELKEFNMHVGPKNELIKSLKENDITKENMLIAKNKFLRWFKKWLQKNPQSKISLTPLKNDNHPQLGNKIADKIFNGKPAIISNKSDDLKNEIEEFSNTLNTSETKNDIDEEKHNNITPEVSVKIIEEGEIKEVSNKPIESLAQKVLAPVSAEEVAEPTTEVVETKEEQETETKVQENTTPIKAELNAETN